ncbi:Reverse transcriptase [Phytophthora palmivora]|uniref:Reverse transcriptase n=1 Tax=Phytophthora palmivora TaxID=4796 RepID=A0A2P4XWR4_9STRA|nr:Reverse transcriptase [Phytophthora palmivora]
MDVDTGPADEEPWVLRFDGACRRNPGPGGAGTALFAPSGAVVWTCSHYMPSSSETNNTAEYTALLLGVQSATHHGATHLNIEGDSSLVIAQVKGSFACRNARLRQLRNRVRHALRPMTTYKLRHIDRKANAHADRLANRALDQRSDSSECGPHNSRRDQCYGVATPPAAQGSTPAAALSPRETTSATATCDDAAADEAMDVEAEIAARETRLSPCAATSAPTAPPH